MLSDIKLNKLSLPGQLVISLTSVAVVSSLCFIISDFIGGYKTVAFILLMVVSILAMVFDILPVLITSFLTALIWNYFFIPPILTFNIRNTEDLLFLFMYLIIASVNAALTYKIRKAEKKASIREEKQHTIKLYNTLLNSLSHELRTPLATIVGGLDTLKEQKNLTEKQKSELFATLDAASMRLNRQVENLLNMNRLESGLLRLKLDWCDMNELVFGMVKKYFSTQGREIVINTSEGLPFFRLDQGLVETALLNIIHNAVQYTPEHSKIIVSLEQSGNRCIIRIEDHGKGFPEHEVNSVFEKFYRLPGAGTGGTGLGLSIAKGCIEAHNGSIVLENKKNGGAVFTLIIPAQTSFINHMKNE